MMTTRTTNFDHDVEEVGRVDDRMLNRHWLRNDLQNVISIRVLVITHEVRKNLLDRITTKVVIHGLSAGNGFPAKKLQHEASSSLSCLLFCPGLDSKFFESLHESHLAA
eukprot:761882-Hanusia_phi.AAC.1